MFEITLVSKAGKLFTNNVERLTYISLDGQQTLLTKHMPISIALDIGKGYYTKDNKRNYFYHSKGLLKFENNKAVLLLDNFVFVEELSLDLIQKELNNLSESNLNSELKLKEFWEFCLKNLNN